MMHHTKYLELHGTESLIKMEKGKHLNLHKKLRKEGKCSIPKEILNKLSKKSYNRRALQKVSISMTPEPFVELRTVFVFNTYTEHLTISTQFFGTNGHSLKE